MVSVGLRREAKPKHEVVESEVLHVDWRVLTQNRTNHSLWDWRGDGIGGIVLRMYWLCVRTWSSVERLLAVVVPGAPRVLQLTIEYRNLTRFTASPRSIEASTPPL